MTTSLPTEMKALLYTEPKVWSIVQQPLPKMGDLSVLVKVTAAGVCGTDLHIDEGEFLARFPLIPGHECVGEVAAVGKDVTLFKVGDRVVADNSELCDRCHYCQKGEPLLCEKFEAHGVTLPGAFAEYVAYQEHKVFKIEHLSPVDATLLEPASCAVHGLEKISPKPGSTVLLMGAGPTGLVLAQLLKCNGGCEVTIAANAGTKMALAKSLNAGDTYIELDRQNPEAQWAQIKKDNPYGFDIVIEATGVPKLLEAAVGYAARGGKIVVYGVYSKHAKINISPNDIFSNELTILGSFSETFCFPSAIRHIDAPKPRVNVKGIVNRTYKLEDWGKALNDLRTDKSVVKAAIVFDDALMV